MNALAERPFIEIFSRYESGRCPWCNCPTRVGVHRSDGSFDPLSVPVSEQEIDTAWKAAGQGKPYNHVKTGKTISGRRTRETVRYAIAMGKHVQSRT